MKLLHTTHHIIKKMCHKGMSLLLVTLALASCDYLDVAPYKRATLDDAMKNKEETQKWLQSLYQVVGTTSPVDYRRFEASTDEFVLPELWGNTGQTLAWGQASPSWTPGQWDETDLPWEQCYGIIGHCHMFLNQLEKNPPLYVTQADKERYYAEVKFVKAYCHFKLLEIYGPIPIMDKFMEEDTPISEFPGRSHFDYCVDYIVKLLDEAAAYFDKLPQQYVLDETWGRANAVVCKALKARLLLYAASPLWNGSFPYPNWKNTKYTTPGYGYELVSHTYSREKWVRAEKACQEALNYAVTKGQRKLLDLATAKRIRQEQKVDYPYIPGIDPGTEEGKAFLDRVMLMRYVSTSDETMGNHEFILGTSQQDYTTASLPRRLYLKANGQWWDGWSGVSPCLYSIEHFYTKNGELPEHDKTFTPKAKWLESAGLDRSDIISLNVGREPRFYACFSFDGDDYSPEVANGEPVRIELRNSQRQGYNPSLANRDQNQTGYFTKKYISPNFKITDGGDNSDKWYPRPIMRLAELYLNLAECMEALGDNEGAIRQLNVIRERAGVRPLTKADITKDMSLKEWIHNERFIELWYEGQRYYDLRRWMEAPQRLAKGKREGLNVFESKKMDPSFEEFNTRVTLNQPFMWNNRMYLLPIKMEELYSNPQLVQAPGY